jgi:signal transduction histidine kinase
MNLFLKQTQLILMTALLAGACWAENKPTINQLKERLQKIDAELKTLAHPSMNNSREGTVGHRSQPHTDAAHTEWVQVNLGQKSLIDQIVLVPTIWRASQAGIQADGFPYELHITIGNDSSETIVASFGEDDHLLPRIAPLVVNIPPSQASWVRVTASGLSARGWDGKFIFHLAELLIFNGEENIALKKPVIASSEARRMNENRRRETLVDGFMPYLMNAAQGEQSRALISSPKPRTQQSQQSITIDLQHSYNLNRIHLHAPVVSDYIPQTTERGAYIPTRLLVEGALQPDFSDSRPLVEYQAKNIYAIGPIIVRNFPQTQARYIRLTALAPELSGKDRVGFAEIELFSDGENVALGKPATGNFTIKNERAFSSLTDGRNLYGNILTTRTWLNQLARRHDLERERTWGDEALSKRYEQQQIHLKLTIWIAGLLAAGIAFTILINRILEMRRMARIRDRLAADMHDELGANLHAIALLSDLSKTCLNAPHKLAELLDRIRVLAERSDIATRHCTNMLEAKGICEDLVDEMKSSAKRLLADLEYDITFEGEEFLHDINPRKRIDLFFFFKECLVNTLRHSEASRVSIHLLASPKKIELTLTDNGCGIDSTRDRIPSSIRRRARLLGGRVELNNPPAGGTCIKLKL